MWIWSPCASTTASAVMGRQWPPATDQPLVSSKQSLSPGTAPGLFFKCEFRVLRQLGEKHEEQSSPLDLDQRTGRINERLARAPQALSLA